MEMKSVLSQLKGFQESGKSEEGSATPASNTSAVIEDEADGKARLRKGLSVLQKSLFSNGNMTLVQYELSIDCLAFICCMISCCNL